MSLTYNGTELTAATYNGADVNEIIYDGVSVWTRSSAAAALGICLVQYGDGRGEGEFAWVRGDGTQVPFDNAATVSGGTALGVVMLDVSGGSGVWHTVDESGSRIGITTATASSGSAVGIIMTGTANTDTWTRYEETA